MFTSANFYFWAILFSTTTKCSADFGNYETVDLTHTQDENARGWPALAKWYTQKLAYAGYTEGMPEQW